MRPLEINSKDTLLQKYISGSISREEMHLLNQYALDDDFLFEALEGLSVNEGNNHKNISSLQKSITAKRNPFRIRRLYLMGAAASIGLLIFAAVNVNKYYNNVADQTITMDTENAILMEAEQTNKIQETQSGISSADNGLSETTSAAPASTQTESKPTENTNLNLPVANQPLKVTESGRESDIVENQDRAGLPKQLSLKTIPSTPESSPALKSNTPPKTRSADPVGTEAPESGNLRNLKKIDLNQRNELKKGDQKITFNISSVNNTLPDESTLKRFALFLEENILISDDAIDELLNGEVTLSILTNNDGNAPTINVTSATESATNKINKQIQQLAASYQWNDVLSATKGSYSLKISYYPKL